MEIPIFQANADVLNNLMRFIIMHESILIDYGALKIQLMPECLLALKKHKLTCTQITKQEIMRAHENESIYMISKRIPDQNELNQACLPIPDENSFWENLERPATHHLRSDVTAFLKKSFFYEKRHKKYFSLHRIPGQSLLQLLPRINRKMFRPMAALAHGPGAIFPLAVTNYGLSSMIYHHCGGVRQWYVIPASQRDVLQKLIEQNNYPKCVHHDDLLINPLVLDKYQIRYYRLVQQPNELVVLASGAASQSFVTDTCWTESCMLALPSWIRDKHAFGNWSWCRDHINVTMNMKMIKLTVFERVNIDRYVAETLGNPSLISIGALNNDIPLMRLQAISDTSDCANQKTRVNNTPLPMKILVQRTETLTSTVPILSIGGTFSVEVVPDETSIADDKWHELPTYERDETNGSFSMDTETRFQQLPSNSPPNQTELVPSDETSRRSLVGLSERNFYRTLFVSGLSQNITERDLYIHFTGCINVVLKIYRRSDKLLQYAFITYRSVEEAKRNPLHSFYGAALGPDCFVEYLHERYMIFITNIPSHVDESDVQRLFPNGYIIEYSPVSDIRFSIRSFTRHALISFDTEQEAKHIVSNADQYQIHGTALSISLH